MNKIDRQLHTAPLTDDAGSGWGCTLKSSRTEFMVLDTVIQNCRNSSNSVAKYWDEKIYLLVLELLLYCSYKPDNKIPPWD